MNTPLFVNESDGNFKHEPDAMHGGPSLRNLRRPGRTSTDKLSRGEWSRTWPTKDVDV